MYISFQSEMHFYFELVIHLCITPAAIELENIGADTIRLSFNGFGHGKLPFEINIFHLLQLFCGTPLSL